MVRWHLCDNFRCGASEASGATLSEINAEEKDSVMWHLYSKRSERRRAEQVTIHLALWITRAAWAANQSCLVHRHALPRQLTRVG